MSTKPVFFNIPIRGGGATARQPPPLPVWVRAWGQGCFCLPHYPGPHWDPPSSCTNPGFLSCDTHRPETRGCNVARPCLQFRMQHIWIFIAISPYLPYKETVWEGINCEFLSTEGIANVLLYSRFCGSNWLISPLNYKLILSHPAALQRSRQNNTQHVRETEFYLIKGILDCYMFRLL